MDVRFLAPARLEFLETIGFYESRAAGLGVDFLEELNRFPFSVIYEVLVDHVLVVAIAHHKRRPGYWRDRQ